MSKQTSSSSKKSNSPKALKSKLKKEEAAAKSSISKTSLLLVLVLLAYNFRSSLQPYLEPVRPYIDQATNTLKPHLENYLPLSISSRLFQEGDKIPEIARIARELRLSWDLAAAELEVKAEAAKEAEKEGVEAIIDKVVEEPKVASRSMEELKEIMQEYTADELSQMLDQAYRG